MKRLPLVLLVLLSISCGEKKLDKEPNISKDIALVKGHINDYDAADSINTITFYSKNPIGGYEDNVTKIDSLGDFEIRVPMVYQKDIGIRYKKFSKVILKGGEKLEFSFDGNDTVIKNIQKSFKFKGPSASLNKNYTEYLVNTPFDEKAYREAMASLEPEDFKKMHDSVFKNKDEYVENFLNTKNISEELKNYIYTDQSFGPLYQLLNYWMNRKMQKYSNPNLSDLPSSFYSSIDSLPEVVDANNINSMLSNNFALYYSYYISDQVKEEAKNNEFKKGQIDSLVLEKVGAKSNKIMAQLTMNQILTYDFGNNQIDFYKNNKIALRSLFNGSFLDSLHIEKVAAIESLLANPILPEKAKLLTFKTEDTSKYLDEIIANAKGKVVYIDNWATWCGPCKSEFKNSTPALKDKFGDDIEFVYLCYQSKEELWKPTISQFKVEGKHYFVERGKDKDLFEQIKLEGFPTYVIVDKKGEIVKSGFEYRPSLAGTTEILTKLVAE